MFGNPPAIYFLCRFCSCLTPCIWFVLINLLVSIVFFSNVSLAHAAFVDVFSIVFWNIDKASFEGAYASSLIYVTSDVCVRVFLISALNPLPHFELCKCFYLSVHADGAPSSSFVLSGLIKALSLKGQRWKQFQEHTDAITGSDLYERR